MRKPKLALRCLFQCDAYEIIFVRGATGLIDHLRYVLVGTRLNFSMRHYYYNATTMHWM